jgi:alpha-tubulin suppressor-like RCC1 family protein
VTAVISNVTYQGSVWLSTSPYGTITSAVEGAALNLGEAMTPITLNYTVNANASSGSSGGSGSGSGSSSSSSSSSSFAYGNNQLSAGTQHTCAILDGGDLKCWGRDSRGQLGDGGTFCAWQSYLCDTDEPSSTAIDLGTGRTAVAVTGGYAHTCAIPDNGDLKCWGWDGAGQLGNGGSNTNINVPSSTAIDLGSGRTAVAISAGSNTACAILDNGDLKCWGADYYGMLGDGGTNTVVNAPSSTAIDLGTGRTAVSVSVGVEHTCAILDNGDLKCWGHDKYGQLGDGAPSGPSPGGGYVYTTAPSSTAIDLGTGRTAVAVSAGEQHTCAILDNGDLKCWGGNGAGQLGDGSNSQRTTPPSTAIDLGTGRTAVAVDAGDDHTCAIFDNGDLKCWGYDYYGQLGDGGGFPGMNINAPSSTAINLGTG